MENQSSSKSITDSDRKLIKDALMKQCDAKDGVADGMISDPLACDFDPEMLACKGGATERFLLGAGKSRRHQESPRGPKTQTGLRSILDSFTTQAYTSGPPFRGIARRRVPESFGPAPPT